MTRDEIIKAFTMRVDGHTLQEIANEFNCSRQYISSLFCQIIGKGANKALINCAYPHLGQYIYEKYRKTRLFCDATGIKYNYFIRVLNGSQKPSLEDIRISCEVFKEDVGYLFMKRDEAEHLFGNAPHELFWISSNGKIFTDEVLEYISDINGNELLLKFRGRVAESEIGKTVFITYEEAHKTLKKLKSNSFEND